MVVTFVVFLYVVPEDVEELRFDPPRRWRIV